MAFRFGPAGTQGWLGGLSLTCMLSLDRERGRLALPPGLTDTVS